MTRAANNPSTFGARDPLEMASFPPKGSVFADADDFKSVVGAYGDVETECAAIEHGVAALAMPWQSAIRITGEDRTPFLDRMLTQELTSMFPGSVCSSFWLNRKGRIEADLRVVLLEDSIYLLLDRAVLDSTIRSLGDFIIADDVELTPGTEPFCAIRLMGPRASELATELFACNLVSESPSSAAQIRLAEVNDCLVVSSMLGDHTVLDVYASSSAIHQFGNRLANLRNVTPVGITAFHDARIRSQSPMFLIDFGRTSLPHETGLLHERVSFTKGCYLGQEVVARMHSLGKPKRVCVAMEAELGDPIHIGLSLHSTDSPDAPHVGVLTSVESHPVAGVQRALAQLKTNSAKLGAECFTSSGARLQIAALIGA